MDCSPPGSSVHGILQARILEWVAIPFSKGPSQPGIEPRSPALQADALLSESQGSPAGKFKECQTHGWNTKVKKELMAHENETLERFSEDKFIQSGAVKLGMGGVPGEDENHQYSRL